VSRYRTKLWLLLAASIAVPLLPLLWLDPGAGPAPGIAVLLAVGSFAAAAAALSRLVIRPLREVREHASALGRGELDARLRWHHGDDRDAVATAVDEMADALGDRLGLALEEGERLRAVLEGMVEGVLVVDAKGRIALANRALRELLSVWGDLEGRPPLEVIRHAELDELLRAAIERSEPVVREIELVDPEERVLSVHAARLGGEAAEGAVAVFHDLTDIRRLEAIRSDFVANASHELRTPITAIRGFAETLLGSDPEPARRRSQLEIIRRNAERLGHLVDDLLELSRIESRRTPLQPSDVDAVRLAHEVLEDQAPMFERRGIEATLESAEPALEVRADRRALDQVLRNLLDNAAKYTDPGGRVRVRITRSPRTATLEVADTGIGIAPEHQARIFERFYRVDASRSRALGGTGLGLAIVKHLVRAMDGEVSVESAPGRGSTFRVRLPTPPISTGVTNP
jgi:two-component system phosphate regulon sensor histidine kinase PhoR